MGDPIRNEMVTDFSACGPLLAGEGIVSWGPIYTVVGEENFCICTVAVKVP